MDKEQIEKEIEQIKESLVKRLSEDGYKTKEDIQLCFKQYAKKYLECLTRLEKDKHLTVDVLSYKFNKGSVVVSMQITLPEDTAVYD